MNCRPFRDRSVLAFSGANALANLEDTMKLQQAFSPTAATIALSLGAFVSLSCSTAAAMKTCDIHNGMKVWVLKYSDNDDTLSHPLGIAEAKITVNDRAWQSKCRADGPNAKIFVPFVYVKGGAFDTRWLQAVYKTKAEAESAYHSAS